VKHLLQASCMRMAAILLLASAGYPTITSAQMDESRFHAEVSGTSGARVSITVTDCAGYNVCDG
jgi:hypothetical protein